MRDRIVSFLIVFVIFVNDVPSSIKCRSILYADDTSLLNKIDPTLSSSYHELNWQWWEKFENFISWWYTHNCIFGKLKSSNRNSTNVSIYYQNVRGLNSKTHTFFSNYCDMSFNIIALTDTWLNDSVSDSELFPDLYSVVKFFNCRSH